jgi:hypothetical protein
MEENAMRLPLQITFRHVDASPGVEDRIREYAGELDRFFDQIMSCRVAVERQHRRHHQGNLFPVRLDITVPGAKSWSDAIRSPGARTRISRSPSATLTMPPAARSRITRYL